MTEKLPPDPSKTSVNRRSFFRHLLLRGAERFEQAGQFVADQLDPAATLWGLSEPATPRRPLTYLRPPGAQVPQVLTDTCSRCGQCVEACPAQCIKLDTHDTPAAAGLPYIIARQSPCVICDDLACTHICPTGALEPLERAEQIRMGTALVHEATCLRTVESDRKEACTVCVEQCPIGASALTISDKGRLEVGDGCTGCGICEWACVTDPASITVAVHQE